MRVPILVVVLLCLGVVAGVWWIGTRDHDFLTPPAESELTAIRERAASSIPPADHLDDVADAIDGNATEAAIPKIEPGDFNKTPKLTEYRKDAWMGAAALASLATELEAAGQPQRALLAWERVLDSAPPEQEQTSTAIASIKRLRSGLTAWNTKPEKAIAITLQAGTGKSTAALLEPVLMEIASELSAASSGILNISAQVTAGSDMPESFGPPPVALWCAGATADSRSTEVLSFTVVNSENLRADVLDTLSQLLRGYLGRTASITVPEIPREGENPEDFSFAHITRLAWRELGLRLNQPTS